MDQLTREQKLEILDKVADCTATKEDIEAAGGSLEILKMIGIEGSKERGNKRKHIYSRGKYSLWINRDIRNLWRHVRCLKRSRTKKFSML